MHALPPTEPAPTEPAPTEPVLPAAGSGRRVARRGRASALRSAGVRRLVAGLLLAWSAAVLARHAAAALQGWRGRHEYRSAPIWWRFGTPQTDRLARCLALADAAVEPGSRIRVLAPGHDSYRDRWVAYLLPAHDVLPEDTSPDQADLVVARDRAALPGARAIGGGPRCTLLRPAGASAAPAAREPR